MTGERGPYTRMRPLRGRKPEPLPPTEPIRSPVPLPPDAQELWDRHAPLLAERQVLTQQSVSGFVELCITYSEVLAVREQLSREGRAVKNAKGEQVRHPLVTQEKQLSDRLLAYYREFGLTGAAKKRLLDPGQEVPVYDPSDPLGLDD